MRKFLVLAGVVAAGASNAVVIDDFTSGAYFNTIIGGTYVDFQGGTMCSGERDVQQTVYANPLGQFFDLAITGAGLTIVSAGFGLDGQVDLQYDVVGDEAGNTGPGKVLTNPPGACLLDCDTIRISWLGNDLAVEYVVTLRDAVGGVIGVGGGVRAPGSGAGVTDLGFGGAVLAATRSVTFSFHGAPSADYGITKLECVPEPASMAAIGLGLAGVVARRRRNKK